MIGKLSGGAAPLARRLLSLTVAVVIGVGVSVSVPASASANVGDVFRHAGGNRFATAAAISRGAFATPGVPVAYVATGAGYADALAAGASAAHQGGPLLLVNRTSIPPETAAELRRLSPAKIVIAGGSASVSDAVRAKLRNFAPRVAREAGPNRYATAAEIALTNFSPGVPVIYVATGLGFPDALASVAAARQRGPILLVDPSAVPAETRRAVRMLAPARIVVVGGTAVVSSRVETQLSQFGPVSRQSGANRFATAAKLSARAFDPGVPVAYVATGMNYPDALAAGPAAAARLGPVLLADAGFIPPETAAELRRLNPDRIVIAGGSGSISEHAEFLLRRLNVEPTGPTQRGEVTRVIDGDTIEVRIAGVIRDIRYIGMDTPEISGADEWLGPEAKAANAALVAGKRVVLETDVSNKDRYGRLLRYVWIRNGDGWLMANLELLRKGLATVATYPPDVKYVDALFLPAQRAAREAGLGLWGTPPPPEPPPPPPSPCDPAYPSVCIPSPPPDLDCGDISYRNFTVRAPDPHGFDGDDDGVGCES